MRRTRGLCGPSCEHSGWGSVMRSAQRSFPPYLHRSAGPLQQRPGKSKIRRKADDENRHVLAAASDFFPPTTGGAGPRSGRQRGPLVCATRTVARVHGCTARPLAAMERLHLAAGCPSEIRVEADRDARLALVTGADLGAKVHDTGLVAASFTRHSQHLHGAPVGGRVVPRGAAHVKARHG